MEVLINLNEYLTEDEIKEACLEAVKDSTKASIARTSDLERIFNNAAYKMVFDLFDAAIDGDLKQLIKDKAISIIGDTSSYHLYRAKSPWDEASIAYKLLEESVKNNKNIIEENVKAALVKLDTADINDLVLASISEVISDKLCSGN